MKRLLTAGISLLAAFAVMGPAFADEPPPTKKRAAPARVAPAPARQVQAARSNWSGGQLGGSNGGSFANNNFVEPGSYICPSGTFFGTNCFETPFGFDGNKASYTIGPFLGYRVQLGNFVVGAETDFAYKNASNSLTQDSFATNVARGDYFNGSLKQSWDGSLRARLGVLVTPWTLLYATGGLAYERVTGSFSYVGTLYGCAQPCSTVNGTATAAASWSDTRIGWTAGGGVETELWTGWKARIEYRYADLGSYSKTVALVNACTGGGIACYSTTYSTAATINLHPTFQTVRVSLGFDF
jgi:outer membrane immunogenic protein